MFQIQAYELVFDYLGCVWGGGWVVALVGGGCNLYVNIHVHVCVFVYNVAIQKTQKLMR